MMRFIVALIGGVLSVVLIASAAREASYLYLVKALVAVAVTASLYKSLNPMAKREIKEEKTFRNKKWQVGIGLTLGLAMPPLLLWFLTQYIRHQVK